MLKKRIDNRRKIPATIQKQAAEIANLAISEHSKSVILRNAAMVEVLLYGRYCGLRSIAKVAQAAGMQDRALQMLLERGQKEFNQAGGKAHTAQALFFLYFHETRANLDLELLDRARENAMNSRRPKDQLDVLKAVSPEYGYDPNGAGAQQIGMQFNQQNVLQFGKDRFFVNDDIKDEVEKFLSLNLEEQKEWWVQLTKKLADDRGASFTIEEIRAEVEKAYAWGGHPDDKSRIEARERLEFMARGDDWRDDREKIRSELLNPHSVIEAEFEITPDAGSDPVENIEIEGKDVINDGRNN